MKKAILAAAAALATAIAAFAQGAGDTQQAGEAVPHRMVRVEGGTFDMRGRSVTLSTFYMDEHPVTQLQWRELMGTTVRQQRDMANPLWRMRGEGDNHPMYYVNWFEAVKFANERSLRAGLTPTYTINGTNVSWNREANGYRLPTEAEWEFAARGGVVCYGNFRYSGSNEIDEVAWHNGNSGELTQPVRMLRANVLGIYDMSGNVWEWVWDWEGALPTSGQATNPAGPSSGPSRMLRGGSVINSSVHIRSASRVNNTQSNRYNHVGFRLVRSAD